MDNYTIDVIIKSDNKKTKRLYITTVLDAKSNVLVGWNITGSPDLNDFGTIYGQSFGERTLTYQFEFMCFDKKKSQDKVIDILCWFRWKGRKNLYDDLLQDYHFEVREPKVKWNENH